MHPGSITLWFLSWSSPIRLQGEGCCVSLEAAVAAFVVQIRTLTEGFEAFGINGCSINVSTIWLVLPAGLLLGPGQHFTRWLVSLARTVALHWVLWLRNLATWGRALPLDIFCLLFGVGCSAHWIHLSLLLWEGEGVQTCPLSLLPTGYPSHC